VNRTMPVVLFTVGLMIAGAAFLKGFGDTATNDPTASVLNGAPRGLLGLHLLLAAEGQRVHRLGAFDEELPPPGGHTILVPPPEKSAFTEVEARALLDRAAAGDRIVVLCDDEEVRSDRLRPLVHLAGAECFRADIPIGDTALTEASGVLPGYERRLYVRGTGRVRPRADAPIFAAWLAGGDAVVLKRGVGRGSITVVGSATVLANDGLARAENAAFALDTLADAREAGGAVLFDERHHRSRSRAAVLRAAAEGTGPITALLVLALLVPLSLLALVPRPGDAPRPDDVRGGAPAAEAQARALAALLFQTGARPPPEAAHPAAGSLPGRPRRR
jgi:hypothetical protein